MRWWDARRAARALAAFVFAARCPTRPRAAPVLARWCPPPGAQACGPTFHEVQHQRVVAGALREATRCAFVAFRQGAAAPKVAAVFAALDHLRQIVCAISYHRCAGSDAVLAFHCDAADTALAGLLGRSGSVCWDEPSKASDVLERVAHLGLGLGANVGGPAIDASKVVEPLPMGDANVLTELSLFWNHAPGCAQLRQLSIESIPMDSLTQQYAMGLRMPGLRVSRVLQALARARVPVPRVVVNVGAGQTLDPSVAVCDHQKWNDPAHCLVLRGWAGVASEGDPAQLGALREYFSARRNVTLLGALEPPDALAAVRRGLTAALNTDVFEVGLLKIDVDNGDCDFLEALLPLKPVLIHIEALLAVLPPPLAVRQRFSRRPPAEASWTRRRQRGCSLQAIADAAPGYRVFQLQQPYMDVWLAREDAADALETSRLPLEQHWRLSYYCHAARSAEFPAPLHELQGPELDPRQLADPSVPLSEKYDLVRGYFDAVGGALDGERYNVSLSA
eukprot:TRINITY_DN21815_c0_g1_i1.p1 TRINITY_DN21815_c0_g1~~TRINITY_DN21815_c0_g1_i1.p1  ORF type:complete len:559 (+),score=101.42 TRINITY_DN21815_c0_g1_i1:161-1678(+)